MPERKQLEGQIFEQLTVIKYLENRKWLCKCSCNREIVVRTYDLTGGKSTKCRPCSNRLPKGESGFNSLYNKYKLRASNHNRIFELDKIQFREITSLNCFYCGIAPFLKATTTKNNVTVGTLENSIYLYNGIDRKDSSKGYTEENSVPCCEFCNKAKRDLPYEEFLNHLKRISNYNGREK